MKRKDRTLIIVSDALFLLSYAVGQCNSERKRSTRVGTPSLQSDTAQTHIPNKTNWTITPSASKTDVQAVVDPFQEGYEERFPDGKMDARKETEGFLYDDTNDFEGKAKREYEEGYEEGYGDGDDAELSRIEDGEEPEEE